MGHNNNLRERNFQEKLNVLIWEHEDELTEMFRSKLLHEITAEISLLVSHELSCMTPKILGKP